ncbi:MAG: prepilin-type N-terminal cleavage/methylation domain-containing protein [Elusimicrobia bacterium]|nr:prepilin-type N-terminal cleavage/methylation domain-containing protein [Elusimicrobiota bacterium]
MKNRKGFTLIELLVVVLIIGILAAIAVPQYYKVVEKGRAAEALTTINAIKAGQEIYYAKYASYHTNYLSLGIGIASTFKHFNTIAALAGGATSWSGRMVRNASPAVYGAYSISIGCTQGGACSMGCEGGSSADCNADLLP